MEHYWGGQSDRFFYERESGRIVGDIVELTDGTWSACYYDNGMKMIGTYIDDARARKAVEKALKNHMDWSEFMASHFGQRQFTQVQDKSTGKWYTWDFWKRKS